MPYYRITIWTKQRKDPFRGLRLMEVWNPDAAYRIVETKAKNHFGESNIIKIEVVMLPKNSPEVKDHQKGKK
ncbi:MAG: hypothetical protein RLZZ420_2443 [Bacteroidota bacterium]